jgi:hypothetical protein
MPEQKSKGLRRESNPGPLAPEARIIPLDHEASRPQVPASCTDHPGRRGVPCEGRLARTWGRTSDLPANSRALCRLSYGERWVSTLCTRKLVTSPCAQPTQLRKQKTYDLSDRNRTSDPQMSACKLYSLMLCQLSYAEGEMCDQPATSADTNGGTRDERSTAKAETKERESLRHPGFPRGPPP